MRYLYNVLLYFYSTIKVIGSYGRLILGVILLGRRLLPTSTSSTPNTSDIELFTVGSGQLNKQISAQGKVSLPGMMELGFNKDGTVSRIYKPEGSMVKQGDIIAELDTTQARFSLQQAQTNLSLAQARLSELMNGAEDSTLTQLENDIKLSALGSDAVRFDLQSLQQEKKTKKVELEQQLKQLSGEIATARLDYTNALSQSGTNIEDTLATYGTQLKTALQQLQSSRNKLSDIYDKMDYLFGVTDQYKNSRSRIYLSAKNIQNLYTTQSDLLVLINRYKALSTLDVPVSVDSEQYDIKALKALKDTINTTLSLIKDTQLWIPSAQQAIIDSVEGGSFTDQTIDQYKASIIQQSNTLDSMFSSLQNNYTQILSMKSRSDLLTDMTTSLQTKQNQLNKLLSQYLQVYNQLSQSDASYDQKILAKQTEQQKQQGQVAVTTQKLEETKRGPTSDAVRQQQLQIQLQQLAVDQAKQSLRDYQIIAPFDAKIEKIDFKEKQQLMGSKKLVTVTNPERYEITVNLDQVDIISIQEGQRVSIILAPYPDTLLSGTVDRIYRIPVETNGTISYAVSVSFMSNGLDIFQDMNGTVSFMLGGSQKTLPLIPLKAIYYDTGSAVPYVRRSISSGVYDKQIITVGLTDGNNIQIVSGLVLGDRIVTSPYIPQSVESRRFGPGGRPPR